MRLDLSVSLDLRFVCVQCGREMEIEGAKERNPSPLLKCPACGFRIQVQQGSRVQIPPGRDKRFPELKPRRV